MKKLHKGIIITSKVFEIGYWIMTAIFVIGVFVAINSGFNDFSGNEMSEISIHGFSISLLDANNNKIKGSFITAFIAAFISSGLFAMIFRNINLIFRTAEGKTKFSKGETPFQKDNVRMIREIGYFCIAIPVIQLIISVIAKIAIGFDTVETSVEMSTLVIGFVVLCLSQFFSYGMKLESDVEGLV